MQSNALGCLDFSKFLVPLALASPSRYIIDDTIVEKTIRRGSEDKVEKLKKIKCVHNTLKCTSVHIYTVKFVSLIEKLYPMANNKFKRLANALDGGISLYKLCHFVSFLFSFLYPPHSVSAYAMKQSSSVLRVCTGHICFRCHKVVVFLQLASLETMLSINHKWQTSKFIVIFWLFRRISFPIFTLARFTFITLHNVVYVKGQSNV